MAKRHRTKEGPTTTSVCAPRHQVVKTPKALVSPRILQRNPVHMVHHATVRTRQTPAYPVTTDMIMRVNVRTTTSTTTYPRTDSLPAGEYPDTKVKSQTPSAGETRKTNGSLKFPKRKIQDRRGQGAQLVTTGQRLCTCWYLL